MSTRLRIIGFFIAMTLLSACSQATNSIRDITGEYTVAGINFDGSPYTGDATITRTDENYKIVWHIAGEIRTATSTFNGTTCLMRWRTSQRRGDAIFTLQPDGSLVGTWTEDSVDGRGTETLTPKQ